MGLLLRKAADDLWKLARRHRPVCQQNSIRGSSRRSGPGLPEFMELANHTLSPHRRASMRPLHERENRPDGKTFWSLRSSVLLSLRRGSSRRLPALIRRCTRTQQCDAHDDSSVLRTATSAPTSMRIVSPAYPAPRRCPPTSQPQRR